MEYLIDLPILSGLGRPAGGPEPAFRRTFRPVPDSQNGVIPGGLRAAEASRGWLDPLHDVSP